MNLENITRAFCPPCDKLQVDVASIVPPTIQVMDITLHTY